MEDLYGLNSDNKTSGKDNITYIEFSCSPVKCLLPS